ncbi:MAG: S-methyl-5-thioribose-1-phosphate isomerase [Firmicutes bacterium]|nr:S-methyl-5-thioribose-1-phosphate isomerase [Bacillota bacterium]
MISPVWFENDKLNIIDQTQLPGVEVYLQLETKEDVWDAIKKLKVRGAPAIGVAAAYGMYISVRDLQCASFEDFEQKYHDIKEYLASSRPTAVNLFWALDRMEKKMYALKASVDNGICIVQKMMLNGSGSEPLESVSPEELPWQEKQDYITNELLKEAHLIRAEDIAACEAMGEYGLSLLEPGMGILTHCNAGTLATAMYGTCLAPIHLGQERGYDFKVFADETRPLLQGARLTSWELSKSGVDVTLICDNMASAVMKQGRVQAVVVGCDRMAANGDGANKIGTSGVAILAKEYGIPFYTYVPTSTIDLNTLTGKDIVIEERDGEEIYKMWYEQPMAPEGVKTYNPAFDVTDHKYITAVITEKGIVYPPYDENLRKVFEKDEK